jgi:4-amino-4-deoxy-L-arabinose transferase-like glycosyltransferase
MDAPRFPWPAAETLTPRRVSLIVAAILIAAFAARIGARLVTGEASFWANSYSYLYDLAEGVASGQGFCGAAGCERPPLYISFLALTSLAGKNWLFIIVPQALMGAGTAGLAFLIGRRMFSASAGLIACALTAFYPYYVMHDTALQDTAMVTFVLALSMWLLLRALQNGGGWWLAGIALGALVLVRAGMAPSVMAVVVWALVCGGRAKLRTALVLTVAILVTLSPWLAYTWRATGAPVLTTDSGYLLWQGNNAGVFNYYPAESIDRSAMAEFANLPKADQAALDRFSGNARAVSDLYQQRAFAFLRGDPWRTLRYAAGEATAAFSWTFNPYRGALAQWVYAASYLPIALLGVTGMVVAWRRPETALIATLYVAFIGVSAVYFAHTSHRTPLDIYWIVFAASVLARLSDRHRPSEFRH